MLTQERTIMDIENVITNRVESDLKDCKLPAPKEDRLDAMCQNQQLRSIQLNNCFAAKTARQSPALGGGSLNFSTSSEDIDMAFAKKPKTIRDPMSHRIIEKRRRDRMNNCLADLSRLIPTNYLKQGQGRIEKTEIIEMAIKLIKDLTTSVSQPHGTNTLQSSLPDRYLGFKECQDEVMRYLVEVEGWDAMDQLCNRLMSHLEQAGEKFRIMNDESLSKVAKEEQYRHADEEMGSCHELKKPFIFKPVEQQPPIYPPPQMAPYPTPINPQVMMSSPVPPVPQEPSPMETQPIYPSFNNFSSAQQITQEHLKRDKHLWTLLQSQYSSTTVDDSGISTDPGSGSSNVTEGDKFSEQNAASNFKTLSETSSANSSSGGTMDSSSEKNGSSVYKFKHNITKRFSQEEKKVNPSDTSSSSSREDKRAEKGKRKYRHVRSRSPSSSHFKNIEALANATGSNEESSNRLNAEDIKLSNYLPAFVLHPIGTHYIPFSIHPSSIGSEVFSKKGSSQNIYHPISIPVNFGGPLLHMERFSIHSDSSASYGSTGSSSADSPSGCSAENSSTCNSENSPSPDQEGFKTQT